MLRIPKLPELTSVCVERGNHDDTDSGRLLRKFAWCNAAWMPTPTWPLPEQWRIDREQIADTAHDEAGPRDSHLGGSLAVHLGRSGRPATQGGKVVGNAEQGPVAVGAVYG
jgi:hypothetical protein